MYLQLSAIQTLFDAGSLKSCTVSENCDLYLSGFSLRFTTKRGDHIALRTQRGGDNEKAFKSVQSALNAAHAVGFRSVLVTYI